MEKQGTDEGKILYKENGTYRFKFTNNQWVKLKQLAKCLVIRIHIHFKQEKYNNFLQQSDKQPTYDLSKKRAFEPPNEEQTMLKKQKSNQHSVLIRIDGTTIGHEASHFAEKTLKDGQGICLNDKGEICVLDNLQNHPNLLTLEMKQINLSSQDLKNKHQIQLYSKKI